MKLEELLVEDSWLGVLPGELQKPYAKNLCRFVEREVRGSVAIYPPQYLIFNALNSTPYDRVKAVILSQVPYHGLGQAMGLAFSVPEEIKGVLLLNTVLTVRKHQANSHAKKGWELFTDAVIRTISQKKSGVVFLLW